MFYFILRAQLKFQYVDRIDKKNENLFNVKWRLKSSKSIATSLDIHLMLLLDALLETYGKGHACEARTST